MGVKQQKNKTKKDVKKDLANGKPNDVKKVKKKKFVSCLQCIKPGKEDGGLEGKYRVAAPELMQDTFMSDSEDEGGEVECPIQQQQQYRYMNSEAGTLHRAKPLEDTVTDGHLWPSNNDKKVATIDRQPLDIGFLVSFVVDARGGAMIAKRRGGVRIIVPPAACAAPTRVTCRAATRRAPAAAPPPLMEGEALASRLLELQPQGAKFLAPVIIEVPIYTSSCREREIVILRSDTGETWQDHYLHNNDNPLIQEALQRERQEYGNTGEIIGESGERVTRIITCDFPHYLACVSRVRQEVHIIGPEGGTISSAHIPQVQAQFPAAALTKRIRVGLQAHAAGAELSRRVLPRHAAVSPVLTVEPRRRKFHRSITLTAPLPTAGNGTEKPSTTNLRLLCSIMGGQARAVWEDVTGSTPLTVTDDCASFTTTVSARFWMMNCQNVSDATKLATELYREMLMVPFEVRIVVLGKRLDALEGRLLVMYITDRYAYETLLQQEHYTEVAHSTSVRFLDGKDVYLEFSGNLVPVTKSGSQPMLTFEAFKDNRVEFTVRVKHHEENPSGRIYFMNEPKVPKGEQSQTPACVLDVELPERIAPRAGKSQVDYLNLDQSGFDALKDELSFQWGGDHNNSLGPMSLERQLNGHHKLITNGDVKYPSADDTQKHVKPQVNGDSHHGDAHHGDDLVVDSNKTKATFDSDEDKTPMNTLEKGKKKSEGGFLGGLADKVFGVFGHSDDKEDEKVEKESSPAPLPKPRESKEKSPQKEKEKSPQKEKEKSPQKGKEKTPMKEKEKSSLKEKETSPSKEKVPPKPAPRIINEEILGKVEDMFKDLKTKPHLDEDVDSQVYSTKLVVDEHGPTDVQEDLYEQYRHMQPVDTPLCCSKIDPFQFYVGCCEGKYARGQKHRHDETSNIVDRIEQVNFAVHEIQQDVSDKAENNLDIIKEEKDKNQQKAVDKTDDLTAHLEKFNEDGQHKIQELEDSGRGMLNDIADSTGKARDNFEAKVSELKVNASSEIEDAKASGTDIINNVTQNVGVVRDNLNAKAMALDFAAHERAEEMKLRGQNKVAVLKSATDKTTESLKDKVEHGAATVATEAQNVKNAAKDSLDNANIAANEKIQSMGESFEGAKEKSKKELKKEAKEAKKKAKEGKNFFTGLVQNIFGEKEKMEDEVKGKIADGKESANKALEHASSKKDEIKDAAAKTQEELQTGAEHIAQDIDNRKKQLEQSLNEKKDQVEKSIQDKTDEAKQAVENKAIEVKSSVQEKVGKIKDTAHETAIEVKDTLHNNANEIGNAVSVTTSNVLKSIEDQTKEAKDSVCEKSQQIKDSIQETGSDFTNIVQDKTATTGQAMKDGFGKIGNAIHDKKSEAKEKANEVGHAIQNDAAKVEQAIKDKTLQAEDNLSEVGHAIHDEASRVGQTILSQTGEAKDAIHDKATKVGQVVEDTTTTAKDKVNEFSNTVNVKTSEAKDKTDEFGNAIHDKFTGFGLAIHDTATDVGSNIHSTASNIDHNINDAANKVGSAIQDKTTKTKDVIHDKATEVEHELHEKSLGFGHAIKDTFSGIGHAISDTFHGFGHSAHEKSEDAKEAVCDKTKEIKDTVEGTASNLRHSVEETTSDATKALQDRTQAIGTAITEDINRSCHEKEQTAQSELDRIRQEAEYTTDQISKSAEDTINAAAAKGVQFQTNMSHNYDNLTQASKNGLEHLQQSASDKVNDLQKSSKQAFDHAEDSTLSTFDMVESSTKDKVNEGKDKWDELQSSTRDTFATMRDDALSLGSSAEDTLHSFQSSTGNTFDSLDDSVKGMCGSVSDSQHNIEESSKELFGDVKNQFEGFSVSADNKLEEIKGTGKAGVESAEARLTDVIEGAKTESQAVADAFSSEADTFTSSLNNLGTSVFCSSGKGFMKDSSTKLLESEKSQSSPSPHKKSSGIPKLKRKK
ncbi:unnamed protein product [Arctia plantaginis]|uniref:ZU5 domain-containing protein n=1 Tax=Arctia plantaginis TaxID=874455 RepID=A0A8S0ZKC9_ARCPL|nr:unnamed protein product [Arctia plantaginis]